ncbi:hypothetical protein F7725_016536 [Dissostichus mawsoni]|uniref:NXPE C-terminal domain-containing protein n=1 Tax=Dissostichus mawsoni TaxID=36200 RepID=A0A7J5Z2R3_DISMA|nr:hypothetical protein F7725_016536 [Dissostichus mawsoni]
MCGVCLQPTPLPLCNFTDLRTGEPWFCFKPQKLSCETRYVNLKVYLKASGPAFVSVVPKKEGSPTVRQFDDPATRECLKAKKLHLYGDSTIRHTATVLVRQLRYIANELDGLIGGADTVVVIGVWAHFGPLPIEIYIRRMLSIRSAVQQLLDRAPNTVVIMRSGAPRDMTLYMSQSYSDWYSMQIDRVLRSLFKGVNVHWVDAWEMVVANDLGHNIHPLPPIIKNMVDILLTHNRRKLWNNNQTIMNFFSRRHCLAFFFIVIFAVIFFALQKYEFIELIKEAEEERLILDSIAWPEIPPWPTPISIETTCDPAHSSFTILPRRGGGQWQIGDQLRVMIEMSDFKGRPKTSGGDFLLARLHNSKLQAGVVGKVVDHLNGSYSAVFSLVWEGHAVVEVAITAVLTGSLPTQVTMVHSAEAIAVLQRLTREHPYRTAWKSIFRSGEVSETTMCGVCLQPTLLPLCNFTDLRTGEPWFCFKPQKLSCETRYVNMKVYIKASGPAFVSVVPKKEAAITTRVCGRHKGAPQFASLNPCHQRVSEGQETPPLRRLHHQAVLRYIANELDGLIGGADTVVVIGVWAHFGPLPIEIYIRRMLSIRSAVQQLLDRAPNTVVIMRSGAPRDMTLYMSQSYSDWYSMQIDRVLRSLFKGLNVHWVDAWEMVVAMTWVTTSTRYLPLLRIWWTFC